MPRNPAIPEAFDVYALVLLRRPPDAPQMSDLSHGDPSVQAGRLSYEVMERWVSAGSLGFPAAQVPVGSRRSIPDG